MLNLIRILKLRVHAARVPVWAARPNHRSAFSLADPGGKNRLNEIFGGPPKIARQRRALPSDYVTRAF